MGGYFFLYSFLVALEAGAFLVGVLLLLLVLLDGDLLAGDFFGVEALLLPLAGDFLAGDRPRDVERLLVDAGILPRALCLSLSVASVVEVEVRGLE